MLRIEEKISYLEYHLNQIEENYADSFKCDIIFFFGDFKKENNLFSFLNKLETYEGIELWITKLTSRIVVKEGFLEVNEIISDYHELG